MAFYIPSVSSFTLSPLARGTKKPYTPCDASTTYIKRKDEIFYLTTHSTQFT